MDYKRKYIQLTLHELLYLISFSILFVVKGIGIYEGMLVFNISIVVSFLCAGLAMLMADYTIFEFIGAIALLGCSFLVYFETGEKAVIAAVLTIIGMKNISLERMMKLLFIIWTVCFYGTIFVHLIGGKEDIILAHNKFGLGFLLRRSLGYPHPNVFHISFIIWMALFMYVWKNKKILKVSIVLGIANILIFLYSVSITGMALGFIYLGFNFYFATRKKFIKMEMLLIKAILPISILVCIIPPLYLEGRIFDILNKLLNTRMNIWRYYLTTFTPGIFGTMVYPPGEHQMSLDGSYLYLLYYYGWIFFSIFIGLTYWTISRCIKMNHKKELAIILGLSIAGIVEPFLYNFSAKNLILIFIGYEIFQALKYDHRRTFNILPWGKKEIKIVVFNLRIEGIGIYWQNTKNICFIVGMVVGIIVSICTGIFFQKPEKIYVQRIRCDYIDNDGILQDEIETIDRIWVLGAENKEARFVAFDGNMITVEWVRTIVANGIIAAGMGGGITFFFKYRKVGKKELLGNKGYGKD